MGVVDEVFDFVHFTTCDVMEAHWVVADGVHSLEKERVHHGLVVRDMLAIRFFKIDNGIA